MAREGRMADFVRAILTEHYDPAYAKAADRRAHVRIEASDLGLVVEWMKRLSQ